MEIFRVPKRQVAVRILLDSGQSLDGVLFAADQGPDGKPGRILDRLNESGRDFLPLASGEDRLLLNRSGIVTVDLSAADGEAEVDREAGAHEVPVRITLVGSMSLVGRLLVLMPPARARLVDYLNAASAFIPVLRDHRVTLLHTSHVLAVRTLSDDG